MTRPATVTGMDPVTAIEPGVLIRRALPLTADTTTIEVDEEGRRIYRAIAYQYEATDLHGTTMQRGAMAHVVPDDFRILQYHLPEADPVGKPVSIEETPDGPLVRFVFADTARARELQSLVDGGFLRAVSVGFIPIDGFRRSDGVFVYTRADLLELSLVNTPSSKGALISLARSADIPQADLEQLFPDLDDEPCGDDLAAVDGVEGDVETYEDDAPLADSDRTVDDGDEMTAAVERLRGLGVDESILALITAPAAVETVEETAPVEDDTRARMLACLAVLRYRR